MMPSGPPRVYLVTDPSAGDALLDRARRALAALPPGAAALQLRAKGLCGRDLLRLARELAATAHAAGQILLVNDRLDVAIAAGADGVHLPAAGIPPADVRRLLPRGVVAVSCHSVEEVTRAREGGADLATFGPVFDTPSKRAYGAPVGLARLGEAARLGLPLVGLGGIEAGNAGQVIAAGAAGVAAIRAWLDAADPAAAAREIFDAVERGGERR